LPKLFYYKLKCKKKRNNNTNTFYLYQMNLDFAPQNTILPSKGCLLVSEPFLADPHFERGVILLCEHSLEYGSFGFVLNRPTNLVVGDVVEMSNFNEILYVGGPVEHHTLHFIHTLSEIPNAILLKNGVYWGGDFDYVKSLAITDKLNPANSRFFVGYSGWGHEQLTQEIAAKSWVVTEMNLKNIFKSETNHLWRDILKNMGGKYKIFANYPKNPRHN
jgi:putative transcriptional regulator